jgi:hypothetical protein
MGKKEKIKMRVFEESRMTDFDLVCPCGKVIQSPYRGNNRISIKCSNCGEFIENHTAIAVEQGKGRLVKRSQLQETLLEFFERVGELEGRQEEFKKAAEKFNVTRYVY